MSLFIVIIYIIIGYGDKAPRSFIGRVFAFIWILIGLCIISIFTATVTTALTTISMEVDVELFGKTVVALNNTEEQRYGVKGNAQVKSVSDVVSFVKSITDTPAKDETQPAGGLIDSYVAGFEKEQLSEEKGVTVGKIFDDHPFTYGFVISNELAKTNIAKCIRRQLSNDESWITDKIQRTMTALPAPESEPPNLFDPASSVFQAAVFSCLGMVAFLTVLGFVWEYFYWKPRLAKQEVENDEPERMITPHTTHEDLLTMQCQEIEEAMIGEVMWFYRLFNQKIEEFRKAQFQGESSKKYKPGDMSPGYNYGSKSDFVGKL